MLLANERTYRGYRSEEGCAVIVWERGRASLLAHRTDLVSHSPTGIEWGYGGSGPAQLALALLADAIGDNAWSLQLYQTFKREVTSRLCHTAWCLTRSEICAWAKRHAQEAVPDYEE